MFSCYFVPIIRHSIQLLCPVFSRKVFFQVFWRSKQNLDYKNIPQQSPSFCSWKWPLSDSCSPAQQLENTTCTACGNQWPILRIAPFHLCNLLFTSGNDEFPLGNQSCLFRHNELPSGCQTCLFRLNEFPSGSQTCLFRHNEFPYGNKYSPSGNNCQN